MGLVFLALPKEFLHGLEKVSIHLRLKGWIGIAHLLFKLPSMKPGSLFWRFHVAMSKVAEAWEDTAYSAALLFIFFLFREHELCCLVASGREPRSCRVFFLPWSAPTVPECFSLLYFSAHMNIQVKQGDVVAPILQTRGTEDFPRPKWL